MHEQNLQRKPILNAKSNELTPLTNMAPCNFKDIVKSKHLNTTNERSKKVQFNTLPEFWSQKNRKRMLIFSELEKNDPSDENFSNSNDEKNKHNKSTNFPKNNRVDSQNGMCFVIINTSN